MLGTERYKHIVDGESLSFQIGKERVDFTVAITLEGDFTFSSFFTSQAK